MMLQKHKIAKSLIRRGIRRLAQMPMRAPILYGGKPDKEYDLDDPSDRSQLSIANVASKIADRYAHYPNCNWAILEFKGSTLRKAIEQLTDTAKLLANKGKKVDVSILVMKRLSGGERRMLKRTRDKLLLNPQNGKPYQITTGSNQVNILLFMESEVASMYEGLYRYQGMAS